ncbi:hypothetical protein [Acidianus manzaensis]|uniref:Uncharacterized protein n=1 Tax=Acidianus manzaensis TaxID=282676 RepID=A0A1W6K3D1_9CREN|nr:hypothetical protein [Acidianus manzaensis]ARM76942.1 hypothetical protein B6F84_13565 [Acidianus manzaensis]
MNLTTNYKIFIFYNIILSFVFIVLYILSKGFVQYYNLVYGILILAITSFSILRFSINKLEDQKIRTGVQAAWLLVSFALGYISIVYAPVLLTSIQILITESIISLIQILWGSTLLVISYRKGYSIIKV